MQHRPRRKRAARASSAWLAALAGLAGLAAAQEPADQASTVPQEPESAQPPAPAPKEPEVASVPAAEPAVPSAPPTYLFLEDKNTLLGRWGARVEALELGTSAGGRELFGVQFGASGPRPLAERATLVLVGGLDGISLAGSQAVIAMITQLLESSESLPPEAAFVAIPWANPDGLARWRSRGTGMGRNDRAIDDDRDGLVDEDGPDDLDRDGMILEMLLETPDGPWVRASDTRFLRGAREGEAPRYARLREGADDDGDGSYNEDGPGGVLLDHNFPLGWEDCRGPESGPWPLSEPDSAALAQLLLARRVAVVLVFQGNHGLLASPGGRVAPPQALPLPEDEPTYRQLVQVFCSHTARRQQDAVTLAEARGENWPGSLVDWSYAALGALAMEIGVWGPGVQAGTRGTVDAYFKDSAGDPAGSSGVSPVEEAWARWLDDTRGGSGFLDWQPTELQGTTGVWIGGWETDTIFNPPFEVLPLALHGLDSFVLALAQNLPRLEVELRENKRDGKVSLVRARVKNLGTLPSGVGPGAQSSAVRLRLEITPGVTLRAGQIETTIGHLPGRGTSDEYAWLLVAQEGSILRIVAESAWSPPSIREVRL